MTRYTIQFPDELYERVKASAQAHLRSAHKEILWLIELGLSVQSKTSDSPDA